MLDNDITFPKPAQTKTQRTCTWLRPVLTHQVPLIFVSPLHYHAVALVIHCGTSSPEPHRDESTELQLLQTRGANISSLEE